MLCFLACTRVTLFLLSKLGGDLMVDLEQIFFIVFVRIRLLWYLTGKVVVVCLFEVSKIGRGDGSLHGGPVRDGDKEQRECKRETNRSAFHLERDLDGDNLGILVRYWCSRHLC